MLTSPALLSTELSVITIFSILVTSLSKVTVVESPVVFAVGSSLFWMYIVSSPVKPFNVSSLVSVSVAANVNESSAEPPVTLTLPAAVETKLIASVVNAPPAESVPPVSVPSVSYTHLTLPTILRV